MPAKFKVNEVVRFIGDDTNYKVIRSYLGNDGMFKYDLSSLDGKITVIAMPENTIHDDSFPKGMEEEIVRLGKKKGEEMKKLTKKQKQQLADLWYKVDNEGFGYYFLSYGPDWEALKLLGFEEDLLMPTIDILRKVQEAINDCEQYCEIDE